MDEDYFFQIEDEITDDRLFILIIYDITNNSKRVKFAKMLLGYGFRIQKSAFEAMENDKRGCYGRGVKKYLPDDTPFHLYKW